jgi:hypothetical protein
VQVVALVPVAGPVPPPIMVVTPHQRFFDLLRADEVDVVSMPPAVTIMPSPAMISVPRRSDGHAGLDVRVAGLADGGDAPVFQADVGLDDAPVVDDQRIGDHGIGHLGGHALAWPMPSRITLPPPNFTSSP